MKLLGVNAVRVNDRGIRDGLMITMVQEIYPSGGAASAAGAEHGLRAVRRFAESCRYEAAHSEHVTRLALSIHAQLGEALGWAGADRAAERRLLEAAGVLHDVGYLVNYTRHHKHSYHLIVHSELAGGGSGGFTRREIEVIANVARYHRQAEPKKRHPNYGALAPEDRRLVRRLAAILRVADGLDRTHTQNARAVSVTVEGGAARFTIGAPEDPATDLWGASRKSDLFRRSFGLEPRFEWVSTLAEVRPEAARVA
jgi:exopolyphosphatase/guanosine-5'-triphosphate,3'-diphosphate pyrophosphatase